MTIHIHTKHYIESGLPLLEYMLCLLYEQREDWSREELMQLLSTSDRTITRIRMDLVGMGYLEPIQKNRPSHYKLTDKLYPPTIKKKII